MKPIIFITSILFALMSFAFANDVKNEKVLLTIIKDNKTEKLTASDLMKLPQYSITTATRWSNKNKLTFTGIKLLPLLGKINNKKFVYSVASNNYIINIPIDKIIKYDPIIAHTANGVRLTTKNKGPLWIIFPYDSFPELQTTIADAWYIWHLKSIEPIE